MTTSAKPAVESAPEEDILRSDALIVDWYRLDQNGLIARILLLGAVFVAPGSALVAVGIAPVPMNEALRALLTAAGFFMICLGPGVTIYGLRRVMVVDHYIALRTDGLICHLSAKPELYLWEDIMEAHVVDHGIELELRDESRVQIEGRFNGVSSEELRKRLVDVRRKALFGMY